MAKDHVESGVPSGLEGHAPSYYAATAPDAPVHSALQATIEADLCIIGGGYTGLSAALHGAEAGLKTVVLEAERVGFGASGRNGGQLNTGQRVDQEDLEARYGDAHARQLWDLAQDAVALVKNLIARRNIDCDLVPGHFHAAWTESHAAGLKTYHDYMQRKYAYGLARYVERAEIPAYVNTPRYWGGLYDGGGAHLHPLRYAHGLARAAQSAGALLFEKSRVHSVSGKDPLTVSTATGRVRAPFVLYACNGYIDKLEPRLARHIVPLMSFIVASEPLSTAEATALIPSGAAVTDSRIMLDYYRLSADRRLLFSGAESMRPMPRAEIERRSREKIAQIFPQMEGKRIDYAWGGTLALTWPRLPHVGRLAPNVFFAQGYSGQGLAIATQMGKLVAEAIRGQAASFDVYAGLKIPALPGGALLREPLFMAAMLWASLRDRLG